MLGAFLFFDIVVYGIVLLLVRCQRGQAACVAGEPARFIRRGGADTGGDVAAASTRARDRCFGFCRRLSGRADPVLGHVQFDSAALSLICRIAGAVSTAPRRRISIPASPMWERGVAEPVDVPQIFAGSERRAADNCAPAIGSSAHEERLATAMPSPRRWPNRVMDDPLVCWPRNAPVEMKRYPLGPQDRMRLQLGDEHLGVIAVGHEADIPGCRPFRPRPARARGPKSAVASRSFPARTQREAQHGEPVRASLA